MGIHWKWIKGPASVFAGMFIGFFLARMVIGTMIRSRSFRVLVAVSAPFLFIQGFNKLDIGTGGPIALIIFGVKCLPPSARREPKVFTEAEKSLSFMWAIMEAALFSLVGCELDFSGMNGTRVPGLFGLMILGLIFRTLIAFGVIMRCEDFTWRHSMFVAVSWIPKATVQAALAAAAVARLRTHVKDKTADVYKAQMTAAKDIETIAILSILITAPLGSFLTRLLSQPLMSEPGELKDTAALITHVSEWNETENETVETSGSILDDWKRSLMEWVMCRTQLSRNPGMPASASNEPELQRP